MDGYYLPRDSYRTGLSAYTAAPSSAGYYGAYPSPPPSYRYASREAVPAYVDRAYALPATAELLPQYPSYPRVPLSGYASRIDPPYELEALPARRHEKPYRAPVRGGNGRPKRRQPPPAQNLGPRKKDFKPAAKAKNGPKSFQKPLPQQGKKGAPAKAKTLAAAERLAQETKELHSLYRTGGNAAAGGPPAKKEPVAGVKRKEPEGKKNNKPAGQKATEGESKKARRKRLAKEKKMAQKEAETKENGEKKAAGAEASKEKKGQEAAPLTEEEKKEAEASLELQRGACKSIAEFLGIEHEEEKNEEQAAKVEGEVKADGEAEGSPKQSEEAPKQVEAPKQETLTPEEEKEREDKGFEFFTKSFEENQELRQLYVEKCSGGTFECLVCYSIDGKPTKKFNNLVSLVMHASKVQRTLKRPEHRAYGRAVCSVLGWDYNKAPKVSALKKQKTDGEAVTNGEDAGNKVDDKSEAEAKVEGDDKVEATDEGKPEDSAKDTSAD